MDLGLKIYEMVVNIIGTLPVELDFVYGLCTIIVLCFVIIFAFFPWILLYSFVNRR